jgi:hypothetical protein
MLILLMLCPLEQQNNEQLSFIFIAIADVEFQLAM